MSERATVTVTITNRLGLHARPAMAFVDAAGQYTCAIRVRKGDQAVDGKSIMEMMMLAATCGSELEITAEGDGADDACAALAKLVTDGFDED